MPVFPVPRHVLALGVLLSLASLVLAGCAGVEVKPKGQVVTGMSVGSNR
ncbi:MAG: hypothetical protein K6C33_07610 [Desulfovibrio sp.]|nr:hypothetical protein [Desulfovibrio sp.]